MRVLLSLSLPLVLVFLLLSASTASGASGGTCGLASPAFCETFTAPVGGAERTGDLDATIWGASRVTQNDNISQGDEQAWADATLNLCGTSTAVHAGTDIRICNGTLVEAMNDNGYTAAMAMYPRQPFDFAGRTGTVNVDVSDNTQGTHSAWPAIVITDRPVPMPEAALDNQPGITDAPRNGIGISLANACGGSTQVGVDRIWTVSNYVEADAPLTQDGCVGISTSIAQLNHVSIQVSATHVTVMMSDAGGSVMHEVADAPITAPLTRGLVWLEDVHYNADKPCETGFLPVGTCQANNTLAWDNFGFDGPVLTRDLGVELPDGLMPGGGSGSTGNGAVTTNLGTIIPQTGSLQETFTGVTNSAGAQAVLLEFTAFPWMASDTYTYSLNGHASHTYQTPVSTTFSEITLALPVPVSDITDGNNVLAISDNHENITAANVDLILAGAGGAPGPTATPTATPTVEPTATPTSTPVATDTPMPTVTATDTPVPTATATPTEAPTATATPLAGSIPTAAPTPQVFTETVTVTLTCTQATAGGSQLTCSGTAH